MRGIKHKNFPAMNKQQTIKIARRAFAALPQSLNRGWGNDYLDQFLALALEEERGHRRWGSDFAKHHPGAASAPDCARMFCVKRIAEYLNGEAMPKGKDYLHIQKSCFFAAALVDEFRADIEKAWAGENLAELAALDYVTLVRVAERAA